MASDNSEMEHYFKIFKNNKEWALSKRDADPAFFEKLASGQAPNYLYAGRRPSSVCQWH